VPSLLQEDTDVPKHAVVKDYTDVFVRRAFVWFYKWIFMNQNLIHVLKFLVYGFPRNKFVLTRMAVATRHTAWQLYFSKAPTINVTDILKLWRGTAIFETNIQNAATPSQGTSRSALDTIIQLPLPRLGFKLDTLRIRLTRQSCIRRFDIVRSDRVDMLWSLDRAIEISKLTSPSSLCTKCRSSYDLSQCNYVIQLCN
jgi:hypothetical protein